MKFLKRIFKSTTSSFCYDHTQNQVSVGVNVSLVGSINGKNNKIVIGDAEQPSNIDIRISGDNNTIIIGTIISVRNLLIVVGCHVPAHQTNLLIGSKLSMQPGNKILLYNSGNKCVIGEDCMFSNNITLRGGDSPHLIFDLEGNYIDKPKGIKIGDHVWVGEHSYIMKNASIADDCIVALASVVTRTFLDRHCAIGGNPAKVIKEKITWRRNRGVIIDEPDLQDSYQSHFNKFIASDIA
jgi:acetyltransferase-like isoleucine patch superfamily enzyme